MTVEIVLGLKPVQMEDKWFIYHKEGWLYFHRSWTGALIYWMKLDGSPSGVRVAESWVNRNPDEYNATDTEYDRYLVDFIIRSSLLKQDVKFPIRTSENTIQKRIRQHSINETGYAEKEIPTRKPWWKFW